MVLSNMAVQLQHTPLSISWHTKKLQYNA